MKGKRSPSTDSELPRQAASCSGNLDSVWKILLNELWGSYETSIFFGTDFTDYAAFFCCTKIQAPELFVRNNPPEAAEAFPRSMLQCENEQVSFSISLTIFPGQRRRSYDTSLITGCFRENRISRYAKTPMSKEGVISISSILKKLERSDSTLRYSAVPCWIFCGSLFPFPCCSVGMHTFLL